MNKSYIGDSIYVEAEGSMIKLYTCNDGKTAENIIYLEYSTLDNLIHYLEKNDFLTKESE